MQFKLIKKVPDESVIGYDFFNNFIVVIDRLGGKMTFVKN